MVDVVVERVRGAAHDVGDLAGSPVEGVHRGHGVDEVPVDPRLARRRRPGDPLVERGDLAGHMAVHAGHGHEGRADPALVGLVDGGTGDGDVVLGKQVLDTDLAQQVLAVVDVPGRRQPQHDASTPDVSGTRSTRKVLLARPAAGRSSPATWTASP